MGSCAFGPKYQVNAQHCSGSDGGEVQGHHRSEHRCEHGLTEQKNDLSDVREFLASGN